MTTLLPRDDEHDPGRRHLLRLAAASIALPLLPMFVAEAAPLTYALKPIKLDDGVWMIAGRQEAITFENGGAIANITILDSSDGAIIIDTGPSRRFGEELAALSRTLTGKDIARVYLTHFHPDHVFGNQGFDAAKIAAPEGVIKGLQDLGNGFSDAMYYIARDWMRGTEIVLPATAVAEGVEDIGGRRLRLLPRAGHTASDLAVYEENSGLLIAGDLAFLDRAPTTPHANIATWRTTLTELSAIDCKRLVPGHGPAETAKRALTQTQDWLTEIEGLITRCFEQGLDMNEAMNVPLPPSLEQIALARYEFGRSVMHLYPMLEGAKLPAVGARAN
ncbi:MAG: quinoprotein relay system zinc metallohydrolase 1 [Hyphomicrobium sp.]